MKYTGTFEDYLADASKELTKARMALETGKLQTTVGRCYDACSNGVRALLQTENLYARTNLRANALFAQHFIRTGRIPTHFAAYLRDLFEERQNAASDFDENYTLSDAQQFIRTSEEFLSYIKANFG